MNKLNSVLFLALLSFSGCQSYDMDFSGLEEKKEGKLLGVMGIAFIVPGVPDYRENYEGKIDVYVIPETSDVIKSNQHWKYNEAAYKYALKHNLNLLENLGQIQVEHSTR